MSKYGTDVDWREEKKKRKKPTKNFIVPKSFWARNDFLHKFDIANENIFFVFASLGFRFEKGF